MKKCHDVIFIKNKRSLRFPYYQTIHFVLKYLSKIDNNKKGKARKITCKLLYERQIEVMQPNYWPLRGQIFPGDRGCDIYRQSAHEGGKVVSPMHLPHVSLRKNSSYSFLLQANLNPET